MHVAAPPCKPAVAGVAAAVGLYIERMAAVVLVNVVACPDTWGPGSCM